MCSTSQEIDLTTAKVGDSVVFNDGRIGEVVEYDVFDPSSPVRIRIQGLRRHGFWFKRDGRIRTPVLADDLRYLRVTSVSSGLQRVSLSSVKVGDQLRLRDGSEVSVVRLPGEIGDHTRLSNDLYYLENGVCNIDSAGVLNVRDVVEIISDAEPYPKEVTIPIREYIKLLPDQDTYNTPVAFLQELIAGKDNPGGQRYGIAVPLSLLKTLSRGNPGKDIPVPVWFLKNLI